MESKGLDLDLLFEALEFSNPHTLFIDDKGTIIKVGRAFQKSSAELKPGKPFDFIFTWLPGSGFKELEKSVDVNIFDGDEDFDVVEIYLKQLTKRLVNK